MKQKLDFSDRVLELDRLECQNQNTPQPYDIQNSRVPTPYHIPASNHSLFDLPTRLSQLRAKY